MVANGVPFINAGDLVDGHVNLETANKITREKYGDLGGAKLQLGDIVYCLRGTLGKNAYIDNFTEGTVASSLVAIRPKNVDGRYLFHVLNSDIEYRQRIVRDEGAAQPNLSAKSVSEFILPIPDIEEQKKISAFLDGLTNLITLHQRKLEKLKIIKKSMLENCFPKNGEKAPKIRFSGFSDDWEHRKLIDLLDQPITDGPHETPNIVDNGIPFISADAIVDNKIDFTRKRGNITEEYDLQCCKKYKPEFHDVFLVKSGSTVGKVAIVETTQRFNIWSPLAAMRCKENSNPYFLFALLQTKENQTQVKDKASNGTQPNLSMRALEQFDIVSPYSRNEQIKIGEFFNDLDHLITLHQRKLELLKRLRNSLIDRCFTGEKKL